jgi:hypothetical protein
MKRISRIRTGEQTAPAVRLASVQYAIPTDYWFVKIEDEYLLRRLRDDRMR